MKCIRIYNITHDRRCRKEYKTAHATRECYYIMEVIELKKKKKTQEILNCVRGKKCISNKYNEQFSHDL